MRRALVWLTSPFQERASILLIMSINIITSLNAFVEPDRNNKVIFIGNKNIAPVVYIENGRPTGVAVEIVQALQKHLLQPVEIKAMDWQEAQRLVAQGEADALIQINQTEERKKIYDFSEPLLESQFSIFVRTERLGISEASNLHGLRVGVESAGLPKLFLEKDPNIQLSIIPNFQLGFKMLGESKLDAIVVDYRVGSYVLAKDKIRNIKVTGKPIAFSYSAIAVKKGNIKLLNSINNALQEIKNDGTYQKILDTWEPKEVIFQTKEQITQKMYFIGSIILFALFIVAIIWVTTLRIQLNKRRVTEIRLNENHSILLSIINSANAYIFSLDKEYRYTSFNQGHAATIKRLYGADIELGHCLFDYMTVPEDRNVAKRNLDRALAGEPVIEEAYSGKEPGARHYFQVSHSPIKTVNDEVLGVTVLAQDMTTRKLAEDRLHRLNRELRAISNCNQVLMRAEDEQALLDEICHIVCDEAGYRMAWVGYVENNESKTVRPVASAGFDGGYTTSAQLTWADDTDRGRGPGGTAIRTGQTIYVQDIESDVRMAPWRESALQHGYRSTIGLPLKTETGIAFGVLLIYSSETNAVTPAELRLLEELAGDLAFGLTVLRTRKERKRDESIMDARLRLLGLADSHSMEELLTASLDEIEALTGSMIGFYHFVGLDQQTLSLQSWSTNTLKNMCTAEGRGSHYAIDQAGVWVDCVRERHPIILNDYASLPHRKGMPEGHAEVIREVVVPIFRGNQIKAIIGVGNKASNYDENDIEIVSQLGDLSWDITERKKAEESLFVLNRELRAISSCNETLMRAVDEQTLLSDICQIICHEAGYQMAWVGFADQGNAKTVRPVVWAGADSDYMASVQQSWAEDVGNGQGPGGEAIRSGEIIYIPDFESNPNKASWLESALKQGYRSSLALPLKDEDDVVFGVLKIYSDTINAFTLDERRLLEELAGDLAFGIVALRTRAERKKMEEALAKREREFRSLTENSPDVIVRYDRECRRIYVNPAFERVNHLSAQQVLGTRPVELSTELAPMAVTFTKRLQQVMDTGIATQIDLQWIRDGIDYCWFVRVIPELDANEEVVSALTIWTEITDRKQLEMALRESEHEFRSLAENSPENIFRYDKQCRVIYANHQVKTTFLRSDESFLGKTPLEIHPDGLYEGGISEIKNYQATLQRVIASGDTGEEEMHVPDLSGTLRTHSVRLTAERDQEGQVVGALAFGRDITDKNRLEEQLRQSQKMEAIGQLAGGVAHDFNNILTAIIGFSNLAKVKMKVGDPQQPLIDHILAASDRAAHLTQSLLAFSRKQVLIPKPVDLGTIVKSIEKLLRRLIGEDIEFTTQLSPHNLIVMADAGQIEQVLMNLATNARDAMPGGGGLSISTEMKLLEKDFTEAHGYGKPGNYALITVSDTGIGMDEATQEKIFEPFFTTKEKGKGTGLGLSMAYGIVKQHEGNISVSSEPGKGTTFKILLPLIAMEVENSQTETVLPPSGGTETLLVAEDDEDVRFLTTKVLRDSGYCVVEAVDGKNALEIYGTQSKDINLLILDIIMPKMNGKEVFDAVKAISPNAKVLFMSGYTADVLQQKGLFDERVQFIAKPMNPSELLKKVREILDGPHGSEPV